MGGLIIFCWIRGSPEKKKKKKKTLPYLTPFLGRSISAAGIPWKIRAVSLAELKRRCKSSTSTGEIKKFYFILFFF